MGTSNAVDDRSEVVTAGVDAESAMDDDGYRLFTASTVTEVIEYVENEAVDCIISDYHLADGTVLDLLDAVQEAETPVVVWTADGNERIASEAISSGAAAYVPRDCDDPQVSIAETVDELVTDSSERTTPNVSRELLEAVTGERAAFLSVVDETGNLEHVGVGAERTFGHDPESLMGGNYFEYVHPEDTDRARSALQRVLHDPDDIIEERIRLLEHDGDWRESTIEFRSLRRDRATRGVAVTTRATDGIPHPSDATERQVENDVLEERRTQDRAVSELTQQAVEADSLEALLDEATELVADALDHDYCNVLEWQPDASELLLRNGVGQRDGRIGSATVTDTARSRAGYALESNEPVVVELSEERFSGPHLPTNHDIHSGITTRIGPVEDPWGVLETHHIEHQSYAKHDVDFVQSVADILYTAVERQNRDRELERYTRIVESIDESVWITDRDNRITFANESAVTVLDRPKDDIIGDHIPSFSRNVLEIPNSNANEIRQGLERIFSGEVNEFEIEPPVRVVDSDTRLDVRFAPLRRDGVVTHLVGVARDVTARYEQDETTESVEGNHRTTIEETPDPFMALDTTTNEVVDCNDAAEQLWGTSRDALVGIEGVHVHPEDEIERYEELIETLKTNPRTVNRFENGDPIEIETSQGNQVEVVLYTERVELPDQTLLLGIFRPASERRWFEDSLTAIYQGICNLSDAETTSEVAETVIETGESALERSFSAVYLYDESDGVLRRSAGSSDAQDVIGTVPTSQLAEGIAWQAFEDGETRVSDDGSNEGDICDSWTNVGSELIAPLGDHGVFVAADTENGAFDDRLIELAERLAGCATDALDRVKREESLEKSRAQLRTENQHFEAVKPFGKAAIAASHSIIDATTRTEVENALCDSLTDLDDIGFAWVATPSDVDDELSAKAWAGQEAGYLDTVDMELDEPVQSDEPTLKTAATKSTVNVSNIADETNVGDWTRSALYRDFQSCLSIPITYHDGLYGVLSVYATQQDAFAPPVEQILQHVVEEAGYAINAVEIRNGALHSRVTELEFTVDDSMDTLYRAADELDCRIEHLNTIPQAGDQSLLEIAVEDVDVDAFEALLERSAAVKSFSTRERGEDRYEVVVSEKGLASRVIELGGSPKRIVMDGAASRLTVELSNETNVRSFVQQLNERETVTLESQKTREYPELDESPAMTERLTDRQSEVLKTAYRNGYFEQPRANTGQDVADAMGISQPAFSTHLRKSEQVVFESIVEEQLDGP